MSQNSEKVSPFYNITSSKAITVRRFVKKLGVYSEDAVGRNLFANFRCRNFDVKDAPLAVDPSLEMSKKFFRKL